MRLIGASFSQPLYQTAIIRRMIYSPRLISTKIFPVHLRYASRRFECIAHVAKRMKSNLFKRQDKVLKLARADKSAKSREGIYTTQIKKVLDPKYRGKLQRSSKTRDAWKSGSCLEIKHLSLEMCGHIASYYRLAIQRNSGDIPKILNAIKAIVLHLSANDENAELNHSFCPFTSNSWCRFQSAKFNGEPVPLHPNYLGEDAAKLVLDLFEDFGYNSLEFIDKVSTGLSSNHNESLHNLLFTMASKTEAIVMEVMRLASALAIIRNNEGFQGIVRLLNTLEVEVTDRMWDAFKLLDASRARQKLKIVSEQQKRYRKKQLRGRTQTKQKAKHGPGYTSNSYSGAKSSKSISDHSSGEEFEGIYSHQCLQLCLRWFRQSQMKNSVPFVEGRRQIELWELV